MNFVRRHAALLATVAFLSAPAWAQTISYSLGALAFLSTAPVANGGTNCTAASITCFNNITGFSAAGTTGTTSTNLVFSTSPSFTTPTLGVATGTRLGLGAAANASDPIYILDNATHSIKLERSSATAGAHFIYVDSDGTLAFSDSPNLVKFQGPLQVSSGTALTLTSFALGLGKMTASASAPGASGGKIELVCGTGAGTAKLVIYAGTSGTASTILDNIGGGVTGC